MFCGSRRSSQDLFSLLPLLPLSAQINKKQINISKVLISNAAQSQQQIKAILPGLTDLAMALKLRVSIAGALDLLSGIQTGLTGNS